MKRLLLILMMPFAGYGQMMQMNFHNPKVDTVKKIATIDTPQVACKCHQKNLRMGALYLDSVKCAADNKKYGLIANIDPKWGWCVHLSDIDEIDYGAIHYKNGKEVGRNYTGMVKAIRKRK